MTQLIIKHVIRALTISSFISFLGMGAFPAYAQNGGSSNSQQAVKGSSGLMSRSGKVYSDQKKIDDQKNAARQKADDAMNRASTDFWATGRTSNTTNTKGGVDSKRPELQQQIGAYQSQQKAAAEKNVRSDRRKAMKDSIQNFEQRRPPCSVNC
jgi:hypothetical protein